MKRLLALAVVAALALGACSTSGQTLPVSGITRDRAIELARPHVSNLALADATSGPYSNFAQRGTGPGDPVIPDRSVWAVRFTGDITICSPAGTCFSPRPATTTVILDFWTGEFLNSSTESPNNQ